MKPMKSNFYKIYGFRIIFVVVFLLSFILMGSRRTLESNSNAVEDWLPDRFQETKDYKWFLKHFPFESYIVVSWEGCEFDEPGEGKVHEDQIELFAQKLVPSQTIDNFALTAPEAELVADLDIENIEDRLDPSLTAHSTRDSTENHLRSLSSRDWSRINLPPPQTYRSPKITSVQ